MRVFGVEVGVAHRTVPGRVIPDRLQPASHVLSTTQGEERVLMDLARGRYYTLNAAGSRIWEQLESGAGVPQIIVALQREYELPGDGGETAVERDVRALLAQLYGAGLVTALPSQGTDA